MPVTDQYIPGKRQGGGACVPEFSGEQGLKGVVPIPLIVSVHTGGNRDR
ncbi:MAG: hypothetical protein ACMUIL_08945 [bacterium]